MPLIVVSVSSVLSCPQSQPQSAPCVSPVSTCLQVYLNQLLLPSCALNESSHRLVVLQVVETGVWVLALILPDVLDLSLYLDGLFGVNIPG